MDDNLAYNAYIERMRATEYPMLKGQYTNILESLW